IGLGRGVGKFHTQGPATVPALQRLDVGADEKALPFADPHAPLTDKDFCAKQLAVAPPFRPAQVHVQGPVPATAEAVPAEQSLVAGAVRTVVPLADPHIPATAVPPVLSG